MYTCPNNSVDYSQSLIAFQEAEPNLFHILNAFWIDWENFSLDEMKTAHERYRPLCNEFIAAIKD
jgi:hypothetical protein